MSTTTCIIIMAVCLLLSAYFSATETAFSSASTTRLKTLAEKGNANAALACRLLEQYDRLLSTILIGNNIVNIATASIGTGSLCTITATRARRSPPWSSRWWC